MLAQIGRSKMSLHHVYVTVYDTGICIFIDKLDASTLRLDLASPV